MPLGEARFVDAEETPSSSTAIPVNVHARLDVISLSSVRRGKHPDPGIQIVPFKWNDLLHGAPPRRRTRGEGAFAVYHHMEVEEDVRVTYSTLVSVDPGVDLDSVLDDAIHVETTVSVQKRAFQELIDRERAFADRLAGRMRNRLASRMQHRRHEVHGVRRGLHRARHLSIRVQHRVGMAGVTAIHKILRGSVAIPDAIVTRSLRTRAALSQRMGRRTMWQGLRDPRKLSTEEKGVVLFLTTIAITATLLLFTFFFALLFREQLGLYFTILRDAGANMLTVAGVPIPAEVLLIESTLAQSALLHSFVLGATVALSAAFAGRMIACWVLYFVGDALNHEIGKKTAKSPRMARAVGWMNRNAESKGFWLLIILNILPLVPDLVLYVFAVSGMNFKKFLGGIAVGTVIKFGLTVALVYYIGADVVADWSEHPIGHIGALFSR